jgi:LuxR family maltose regulon positive regulatory protein
MLAGPTDSDPAALTAWLPQTKFYPPAARPDLVPRPHLAAALHAAAGARLTLITAPAGYGKTTLVAEWLATPPAPASAWLALDAGDNDLARFLTALIAAVRRLAPACGTRAAALIAGGEPAIRPVVGALINEILETITQPAVLVLDDLHLLTTPEIYVALDYLLDHLPATLRLIVLTRQDPPLALARLRARGQLAELRVAALRFSAAEAAAFLNEQVGLGLAAEPLTALHTRTEGWPAGVRLLAGALERGEADPAALERAMSQAEGYLFEFLAEEVLRHQDPDVRRFLLDTAILPTLTPALCAAVTGRADAETVLADLARRNLFLTPVAGPAGSYQYHTLFAEFLRRQLDQEVPARGPDLHRRAAEAATAPEPAIRHYLAAGLWDAAAARISAAGDEVLHQGWVETVRAWIDAVPPAVRQAHPRLLYLRGVAEWQRGAWPAANAILQAAQAGMAAAGDSEGEGQALAYLGQLAALHYRFAEALAYLAPALARPLPPARRAQLLLEQAHALLISGRFLEAHGALTAALDLGLASDDPAVWGTLVRYYHPPLGVLPGAFARFDMVGTRLAATDPDPGSPLGLTLACQQATRALRRGQSAAAQAQLEAIWSRAQAGQPPFQTAVLLATTLAHAHLVAGAPERAGAVLAQVLAGDGGQGAPPAIRTPLLYLAGRAHWAAGQIAAARAIAAQLPTGEADPPPAQRAPQQLLDALLAWAAGDYPAAEAALRPLAADEDNLLTLALFASPRLLLAAFYAEQGQPEAALRIFAQALARYPLIGEPGYLMREGPVVVPVLRLALAAGVQPPLMAEVLALLGAAPTPPDAPAPAPRTVRTAAGDTLSISVREQEVLRLLATGAGNRAIAAHLVIGEQTVKTHLIHLFRKLEVTSRTAAVQRARDLGLI